MARGKAGTAVVAQPDESEVVIDDEFEAVDPLASSGPTTAEEAAVADTESDQAEPPGALDVAEPGTASVAPVAPVVPVAVPADVDPAHRTAMAERVRSLQASQAARSQSVTPAPVFGMSPEDLAKLKQKISATAQEAAEKLDPGGISGPVAAMLAETITEGVTRELTNRFSGYQAESHRHIDAVGLRRTESLFRRAHPDYESRLAASGLWEAVAISPDGSPMYPEKYSREMFMAIYGDVNPPAAAYDLAIGIMEDRRQRGVVDVRPATATTGANGTAPVAPVPAPVPVAPVTPAEIVAAERRGAAAVTDVMASNSTRPRGVGSMPSAGAPSAPKKWDKSNLARLIDSGPAGYDRAEKLFEANPGMREWYYS